MSGAYLGDVALAANQAIRWAQTTGVKPYSTTVLVHVDDAEDIEKMLGEPQVLRIVGLNGEIEVEDVYPLYGVPTSSPNRRAFLISDKRWLWPYKLVVRDYNVTRKTGDKMLLIETSVPIELAQYVDRFKYMTYSLDGEESRWRGRRAIEDVLGSVTDGEFEISSFSLSDSDGVDGQISIQNLLLRDSGDIAVARVLGFVPGMQVTVDLDGTVRAFDGTDIEVAEKIRDDLGPISQLAQYPMEIDRSKVRPKSFKVYTVREIEIRLDINENLSEGATVTEVDADDPFVENVIPLPDPKTKGVKLRDEDRNVQTLDAPMGTWCPIYEALRVWEEERQEDKLREGMLPFSFSPAIENHYFEGKLMYVWYGPSDESSADTDLSSSLAGRVRAFLSHFRRTYRVNPKYMARIREVKAVRAGLLDPITGARAPSLAWMNYYVIPSNKTYRILGKDRKSADTGVWYNVKGYPGYEGDLWGTASQFNVRIVDSKLGIFSVSSADSPYDFARGMGAGQVVDATGKAAAGRVALRHQDDHPMAPGCKVESVSGAKLSGKHDMATVLTFIPNSPNDKSQLHVEEYTSEEIAKEFSTLAGIESGDGPEMEIFIPPSTCVARFAWDSNDARATIRDLMGTLGADDDVGLSEDRRDMPGYLFVNGEDEIPANSKAAAAEILQGFSDTIAGGVQTSHDSESKVDGALQGIDHTLGPSGRFMKVTKFRERQISVDRFALLPNPIRHMTLGIIAFQPDDR